LSVLLSVGSGQRSLVREHDRLRTLDTHERLRAVTGDAGRLHEDFDKTFDDL
jgi:hypothetical protein